MISPLFAALIAMPPRVMIFPPIVEGDPIAFERLRAFQGAVEEAGAEVLIWRRWDLIETSTSSCKTRACFHEEALELGATHSLSTSLLVTGESCRARGTLFDLRKNVTEKSAEELIAVCTAANLIAHGEDLARRVAEGPRSQPQVTLNLTPLDLPSIDIPNIPEVGQYQSATVALSLDVYRSQALALFDNGGRWFVARSETLLNDCQALEAAKVIVTKPLIEHCEGNWWELAWLGAPLGAVGLFVSFGSNDGAAPGLVSGVILLGSGAAALLFNEDAADPEDGDHILTREQMEEVVLEANSRLRSELGLSERDLVVGGLDP